MQLYSPHGVKVLSQVVFEVFPSITTTVRKELLLLLSCCLNPGPDIIALWAERLTERHGRVVAVDDIIAWVRHQALNDPSQTASSSYRPLTPALSTTPEPPGPACGSAMELDSPVIAKWEILAQSGPSSAPPRELDVDNMDIDLPPPSAIPSVEPPRVTQPRQVPHHVHQPPPLAPTPPNNTPISNTIQQLNLSTIQPGYSPPLSITEANRRFSPFTDAAQRFLNLLEGGRLETLGWPKGSALDGDDPFVAPV